jgi:putative holliday junction resolvase
LVLQPTKGFAGGSASDVMRVLALDHGAARCGCAVSDPLGTLATPLAVVERPDTRKGLGRIVALADELAAERVVVGLPLTLAGEEGEQAAHARAFADNLRQRVAIPVDLYDERLTTRMAAATGGKADEDSVAAAHLLESYLAAQGAGA